MCINEHWMLSANEKKLDGMMMPSPSRTLVKAAEAAHPPRSRRHPHRLLKSVTLNLSVFRSLRPPLSYRDWAGLPPEIISSIFHRLHHVEIMLRADKVCRSWRRAARDEPELWRRIHMHDHANLASRDLVDLGKMVGDAVLRSQGQCESFTGEDFCVHDKVLRFLSDR